MDYRKASVEVDHDDTIYLVTGYWIPPVKATRWEPAEGGYLEDPVITNQDGEAVLVDDFWTIVGLAEEKFLEGENEE